MEKKVKFSDIVCASKVGAHLNNSLMELQLLMKDYTTVPIWGQKISQEWEFGEGNPRLYGIAP